MSDNKLFNIIFQGRIDQGASPQAVRANLAKLFRMTPDKVESLFSGQRVVLKRDADQATVMKFRAALKQAGALCEVEQVGEAAAQPAAQATQKTVPGVAATSPAEKPAASSGEVQTVGTIRTGGTGFSGAFDVAETGADLAAPREVPAPFVPETGHLSLAPAGATLEELPRAAAVAVPDLSHLSVAPAGADLSGS